MKKEEGDKTFIMDTQFNLKSVMFLGRRCMVLCQNENGPCPLLAIANVLLLQNVIYIHPDRSCIALSELIVIVANTFVEKGTSIREESESRKGLQQQQLNSVLNILPSLARGLDLNVRFAGVTDFEFTEEISVFDALDIPLLHGWVLDPQDTLTSSVIKKNHSFNHLMYKMVEYRTVLENISSKFRSEKGTTAEKVLLASQAKDSPPIEVDLISFDQEKQSDVIHGNGDPNTDDSWETVNRKDQKNGGWKDENNNDCDTKLLDVQDSDSPYVLVLGGSSDYRHSPEKSLKCEFPSERSPDAKQSSERSPHSDADKSDWNSRSSTEKGNSSSIHETTQRESSFAEAKVDAEETEFISAEHSELCREGEIIEQFLSSTASQLTYIGLAALHQNIRERQFAVFFRNNHFSTIFMMQSQLFLLVTDLGYQNEPCVVWERLDGIDG